MTGSFVRPILKRIVLGNLSPEVSLRGAGFVEGSATGIWSCLKDVAILAREFDCFVPRMRDAGKEELYATGWQLSGAGAIQSD
jgi:hypothetical protein